MLITFSLKEKEIEFSEFEIQRRIDIGDKRAEKMLNKKRFTPVYNYFLRYFGCICMILSIISISKVFDFYQSVMICFVAFLISKGILKSGVLAKFSAVINRRIIPVFGGIYFCAKFENTKSDFEISKQKTVVYFLFQRRTFGFFEQTSANFR